MEYNAHIGTHTIKAPETTEAHGQGLFSPPILPSLFVNFSLGHSMLNRHVPFTQPQAPRESPPFLHFGIFIPTKSRGGSTYKLSIQRKSSLKSTNNKSHGEYHRYCASFKQVSKICTGCNCHWYRCTRHSSEESSSCEIPRSQLFRYLALYWRDLVCLAYAQGKSG
jgi:hypothetical protein